MLSRRSRVSMNLNAENMLTPLTRREHGTQYAVIESDRFFQTIALTR